MTEADAGRLAGRYRRELRETSSRQHDHVLYTRADFNSEERQRRNALYVMVVEGGLGVCKRCGAAEIELEKWPTCAAYRARDKGEDQ